MSFKNCAQYNILFMGGDFIILEKNKNKKIKK